MNNIRSLYQNCKGKRVLVRIDANLSEETVVKKEKGVSLLRIERSLKTIQKLSEAGAKVILATHLGDDGSRSTEDLIPLFELYDMYVGFFGTFQEQIHSVIDELEDGEILLLQNTRALEGETENSESVSEFLASLCDVFVNDAFSVSHRRHSSVVGVSQHRPSYLGEGIMYELSRIDEFKNLEGDLGVVMGGNKLSTKLPLVEKFLKDENLKFLLLGGALAHPVYQSLNIEIGESLTDKGIDLEKIPTDDRLIVPDQVITKNSNHEVVEIGSVGETDAIWDAAPDYVKKFAEANFKNVKKIFWNGPLGNTPAGYTQATEVLISKLLTFDGPIVVGGGDTLDIVPEEILNHKNIFVSTGGGALLDYLSEGSLVGVRELL